MTYNSSMSTQWSSGHELSILDNKISKLEHEIAVEEADNLLDSKK